MFNLFNKKQASKIHDLVWIHGPAKKSGLLALLTDKPDAVLIAWFEETREEFTQFLQSRQINSPVYLYREFHASQASGKPIILLEHYPLAEKEKELFQNFTGQEILILSALDEPLFKRFGGDKIADMMKKLGIDETESVSHNLISSAITNAQEKIAKKISIEQSARSAGEWLDRNYPV